MSMGFNRTQLLLVGGLVLTAGGLGWFGLNGLAERQMEAEALAERMGNPALAALLSQSGGINRATRDAAEIQKLGKDLQRDLPIASWIQATQKLAGDGKDWAKDPGKWKDQLILIQSQLQKDAKADQVKLSPEFYLGLDGFRQKSPTTDEVPELALHLSVAERLVRRLLEARKVKEQYPTVCEVVTLSGPGSDQEKAGQRELSPLPKPGRKPGAPDFGTERKSFKMEIRCSPEVLYEYVKLLAGDPALLLVTDFQITNEKQSFPLRSEIAKKFAQVPPAGAEASLEGKTDEKKLLEILAGEEALNVILGIEFVAWKGPEEPKAAVAPAVAP